MQVPWQVLTELQERGKSWVRHVFRGKEGVWMNYSKTGRLIKDKSTVAERVPMCNCAGAQLPLNQH